MYCTLALKSSTNRIHKTTIILCFHIWSFKTINNSSVNSAQVNTEAPTYVLSFCTCLLPSHLQCCSCFSFLLGTDHTCFFLQFLSTGSEVYPLLIRLFGDAHCIGISLRTWDLPVPSHSCQFQSLLGDSQEAPVAGAQLVSPRNPLVTYIPSHIMDRMEESTQDWGCAQLLKFSLNFIYIQTQRRIHGPRPQQRP